MGPDNQIENSADITSSPTYLPVPQHLNGSDPIYKEIFHRYGLNEGLCFFGALTMITSSITRQGLPESFEQIIATFTKYDEKHLTRAFDLLPVERRVQGFEELPPFVTDEGVDGRYFKPYVVDYTLELLNAMFSQENIGIKIGYLKMYDLVRDITLREGAMEKLSRIARFSDTHRNMVERRVASSLMNIFADYGRHQTGLILPMKGKPLDGKGHVVAATGVAHIHGQEETLIIHDVVKRREVLLPKLEVVRFFDIGGIYSLHPQEDQVFFEYSLPALLVSPAHIYQ